MKASDLVIAAKSSVENLSVEAFEQAFGNNAVIIDLREPEEITTNGSIPGALRVPRGMLEFTADPNTPYYNPVFEEQARLLLYCAAGSRSALSAATLQWMGYTNVAHLTTGFAGWRDAGKPIEKAH